VIFVETKCCVKYKRERKHHALREIADTQHEPKKKVPRPLLRLQHYLHRKDRGKQIQNEDENIRLFQGRWRQKCGEPEKKQIRRGASRPPLGQAEPVRTKCNACVARNNHHRHGSIAALWRMGCFRIKWARAGIISNRPRRLPMAAVPLRPTGVKLLIFWQPRTCGCINGTLGCNLYNEKTFMPHQRM